jgi:carboxymethylenebutenolidase
MDIQEIFIPVGKTQMTTLFVHPQPKKKVPAIILLYEIWGINDNMRSIAERLAREGYAVIVPDLLGDTGVLEKISPSIFREMGDPKTKDEAQKKMREALAPMHQPEFAGNTLAKLDACYADLRKRFNISDIAIMGFCFGGTYSYAFASHEPRIKACIPFYGQPPKSEDIPKITCPILAFYGERDATLVSNLPELLNHMKTHRKRFTHKVYLNTGHAFFNDTNPHMYNEEAAKDSWKILLQFLKNTLK